MVAPSLDAEPALGWQPLDVDTFARWDDDEPEPEAPPPPATGFSGLLEAIAGHRPAWMADAACRGTDVALFFPERGHRAAQAKALCAGCPVAGECADYAAATDAEGIWAGAGGRTRKARAAA